MYLPPPGPPPPLTQQQQQQQPPAPRSSSPLISTDLTLDPFGMGSSGGSSSASSSSTAFHHLAPLASIASPLHPSSSSSSSSSSSTRPGALGDLSGLDFNAPADFNPFRSTSPNASNASLAPSAAAAGSTSAGNSNPFRQAAASRSPSPLEGNPFSDGTAQRYAGKAPAAAGGVPDLSNPFAGIAPSRPVAEDPFAGMVFAVPAVPVEPFAATATATGGTGQLIDHGGDDDALTMDMISRIALEEKGHLVGVSSEEMRMQEDERRNLAEASRIAALTVTEEEDELLSKQIQELEDEEFAQQLAEGGGDYDGYEDGAGEYGYHSDGISQHRGSFGGSDVDDAEMARRLQQELEDEEVARQIAESERDEQNIAIPPNPVYGGGSGGGMRTVPQYQPPAGAPPSSSSSGSLGVYNPVRLNQPTLAPLPTLGSARIRMPKPKQIASRFFPNATGGSSSSAPASSSSTTSILAPQGTGTSSSSSLGGPGGIFRGMGRNRNRGQQQQQRQNPLGVGFTPAPASAGLPSGAIVVPPGSQIPEGYVFAGVAPERESALPPPPYRG
ncbi:hypothetical protein HDU97_006819 [Phlyctochytrium planicorne]|nr:hypothetical protein HDU97_006819 [Phlyctochytrium planicorne]